MREELFDGLIGLVAISMITLTILRLTGHINWSWGWILSPVILIGGAFGGVITAGIVVVGFLSIMHLLFSKEVSYTTQIITGVATAIAVMVLIMVIIIGG